MTRDSEGVRRLADARRWLRRLAPARRTHRRVWARLALAVLLVANLAAALLVFKPWGGSAEDLARELAALRQDVERRRDVVARLRAVVSKVETARQEAEQFVSAHFLERRTVSSVVLSELDKLSREAGIRQKEGSYLFEPVEGSDQLSMMTINAAYEGTYADLMHFLNLLDRSPRLLILSDLQAAPQASGLALNLTLKLNAFVRDEARPATATPAETPAVPAAAPETVRP